MLVSTSSLPMLISSGPPWMVRRWERSSPHWGATDPVAPPADPGTALPELAGQYLYSDYCSGWLKSFSYGNGTASAVTDWGITNVGNFLSFGQDAQNELYMLSGTGKVYQIVRK